MASEAASEVASEAASEAASDTVSYTASDCSCPSDTAVSLAPTPYDLATRRHTFFQALWRCAEADGVLLQVVRALGISYVDAIKNGRRDFDVLARNAFLAFLTAKADKEELLSDEDRVRIRTPLMPLMRHEAHAAVRWMRSQGLRVVMHDLSTLTAGSQALNNALVTGALNLWRYSDKRGDWTADCYWCVPLQEPGACHVGESERARAGAVLTNVPCSSAVDFALALVDELQAMGFRAHEVAHASLCGLKERTNALQNLCTKVEISLHARRKINEDLLRLRKELDKEGAQLAAEVEAKKASIADQRAALVLLECAEKKAKDASKHAHAKHAAVLRRTALVEQEAGSARERCAELDAQLETLRRDVSRRVERVAELQGEHEAACQDLARRDAAIGEVACKAAAAAQELEGTQKRMLTMHACNEGMLASIADLELQRQGLRRGLDESAKTVSDLQRETAAMEGELEALRAKHEAAVMERIDASFACDHAAAAAEVMRRKCQELRDSTARNMRRFYEARANAARAETDVACLLGRTLAKRT